MKVYECFMNDVTVVTMYCVIYTHASYVCGYVYTLDMCGCGCVYTHECIRVYMCGYVWVHEGVYACMYMRVHNIIMYISVMHWKMFCCLVLPTFKFFDDMHNLIISYLWAQNT